MSEQEEADTEFIERLVEALRSGEYKQVQNALKTEQGFCCLGVACDIYEEGEWELGSSGNTYYYKCREGVGGDDICLPMEIQRKFGRKDDPEIEISYESIKEAEPEMAEEMEYASRSIYLSVLNDRGYSFDRIADVIEEEFLNG